MGDMTDESDEPKICSCGYPDGTFACKIRHQYLQHGWAASSHS